MQSKPIFISQATSDKQLANKFVELMELGIGISDEKVFCISHEESGVPTGEDDYIKFIKKQIVGSKVAIVLLTPHYYASQFCLCELGALWGLSRRVFTMLLPPLKFDDIKGVLKVTQMLNIKLDEDLNKFRDEISKILETIGIKAKGFSSWDKKRHEFMQWITEYIEKYIGPERVDPKAHSLLEKNYDGAKEDLGKAKEEIKKLEDQIKKLSLLKDAEEVDEIMSGAMPDSEKFKDLVDVAERKMAGLPAIVTEALYYHLNKNEFRWSEPDDNDASRRNRAIQKAVDEKLLLMEEGCPYVSVNTHDPKVSQAITALENLRSFINNASIEFSNSYKNEYGRQLDFVDKRFWKCHKVVR
jgi:hypothetical protein